MPAPNPPRTPLISAAIRLSTTAIDSYRFHHGGSMDSAKRELQDMLSAFAETAKLQSAGGYVTFTQDGYKLILKDTLDVVTGYTTLHRERTWAQHQAGVVSRFPGGMAEGAGGVALKEPAEWRPLDSDPASIEATRRVWRDFAFRAGLRDRPIDEMPAALRAFIAAFAPDTAAAVRTDDTVEITRGEVRLVLSADQTRVIRVLWPRQPEQIAEA